MHCTYSNAEVGETREIKEDSINASSNSRDVLYHLFEGGTGRLERMEIKESCQSWTCNVEALAGSVRDSPDFKSSTTLVITNSGLPPFSWDPKPSLVLYLSIICSSPPHIAAHPRLQLRLVSESECE